MAAVNLVFENIEPWVGLNGDTGLTSRLKIQRNFEKIKAWADSLNINQYWHMDGDGNVYCEYNVYSLGGVSALGIGVSGGGGGQGGGVSLGALLTSLNSVAMPATNIPGYLHWTGSGWAFDTPSGSGGLDEGAMWAALRDDTYDADKIIDYSHLPDLIGDLSLVQQSDMESYCASFLTAADLPSHKTLTIAYGSVKNSSNSSYDTTSARTVTIPKDTSHLNNGAGFQTSSNVTSAINTRLNALRWWGRGLSGDSVTGDMSSVGHIAMQAAKAITIGGTQVLSLNSSNQLCVGYGGSTISHSTYIDGTTIYLRTGTTRPLTTVLTLDANGDATTGRDLYVGHYAFFAQDNGIYWHLTAENVDKQVLTVNANELALGFGTRQYRNTIVNGKNIIFTTVGTNNTAGQRAIITQAGYMGIGTPSPDALLHVAGRAHVTEIRIGDGLISWDATNNALKVTKQDGSVAHFYAMGGVSALGIGVTGNSGQLSQLDLEHATIREDVKLFDQTTPARYLSQRLDDDTLVLGFDSTAEHDLENAVMVSVEAEGKLGGLSLGFPVRLTNSLSIAGADVSLRDPQNAEWEVKIGSVYYTVNWQRLVSLGVLTE